MEHRSLARHVRRSVGTAVVTAVLTGIAAPAFAGNPTRTPAPSSPSSVAASPFTDAAISRSVIALAADVAKSPSAAAKTQTNAPQSSNRFFKSRTGVIILAIFAAGTGYAIYSAKEDRIRGRNR